MVAVCEKPGTRMHRDAASQPPMAADHDVAALLLNVEQVAALLNCSPRHVYRLCDTGRMPRPVRLGSLTRWPKATIEAWIAKGCPAQARR